MADYDFGPEWFWRFIFIMAMVGIIGFIVGLIIGIIWLYNHIQII